MPTKPAKRNLTKKEAQARTDKHKRDFQAIRKGWVALGKDVAESVDLSVPEKLGLRMYDWLEQTFEKSASNIFRQVQNYRALRGIPQTQLEKMPEANAHLLATKLPAPMRKSPAMIEKAVTMAPEAFKQEVADIREKKFGITPSRFKTFAVAVPVEVYELIIQAQNKIGRVLQLDMQDENSYAKSLITVWEAIAVLVNDTPEEWLTIELIGSDKSWPYPPKNGTKDGATGIPSAPASVTNGNHVAGT